MSRLFYHVMQDNLGNLLFNVTGTVRVGGEGTLATIYGDEALTVILPNPMTNHPSFGSFKFYLGAGAYDFYLTKPGYTFETLTGIQGLGTMAAQNANNVLITGGSITGLADLGVTGQARIVAGLAVGTGLAPGVPLDVVGAGRVSGTLTGGALVVVGQSIHQGGMRIGSAVPPGVELDVTGAARVSSTCTVTGVATLGGLSVTGGSTLNGRVTVGSITEPGNTYLRLDYERSSNHGLLIAPSADTGSGKAIYFATLAGTAAGSIDTTATTTTYNTTSDARLKDAVTPLTGALDVVQALNPVAFRWKVDGSPGRGFLAHEVGEVVDGVITGEKDAVDDAGQVLPQQIDHSKLVPWLVAAVKELTQQVEMLTAKLAGASA